MSTFIEIYPTGADIPPPPIGYTIRVMTYIPTVERVGSGWPETGVAAFVTRRDPPKRAYLALFEWKEMFEMKRYMSDEQGKRGKWKPSNDPTIAKRPQINQLCTDCFWEDGKLRQPCNLKLRFGDEQATVVISDDENRCSIVTTAGTVEEALDLLEDALAGNKVRWKPWGDFGVSKKGKRG